MKNYIIIENKLYNIKAKDKKRLEESTKESVEYYRGNKLKVLNSDTTEVILEEITKNYKPIGDILAIFN